MTTASTTPTKALISKMAKERLGPDAMIHVNMSAPTEAEREELKRRLPELDA